MKDYLNNNDILAIKDIVYKAGNMAYEKQKKGFSLKRKKDRSIVTEVDITVQAYITDMLSKRFNTARFINEEENSTQSHGINNNGITFIIDPIDGTAMYSMYLPEWCVSVGVLIGYTPAYGFVYSPGMGLYFYNDNDNSYCNDKRIKVDKNIPIDNETNIFFSSELQCILPVNFPGKVRNLGSTAIHACLTIDNARNRTLAFIGRSWLWDWAGALPIIDKAGGHIRYVNGMEVDIKKIIENEYLLKHYCVAYSIDDFKIIQNIFKNINE